MRVWHYRNGPRCVNLNVSIGLDKPSAAVFSFTITAGPAGAAGPLEHRESPRVRPDQVCRGPGSRVSRRGLAPVAKTVSQDRKSTRLNSSHGYISYSGFFLEKKNQ